MFIEIKWKEGQTYSNPYTALDTNGTNSNVHLITTYVMKPEIASESTKEKILINITVDLA